MRQWAPPRSLLLLSPPLLLPSPRPPPLSPPPLSPPPTPPPPPPSTLSPTARSAPGGRGSHDATTERAAASCATRPRTRGNGSGGTPRGWGGGADAIGQTQVPTGAPPQSCRRPRVQAGDAGRGDRGQRKGGSRATAQPETWPARGVRGAARTRAPRTERRPEVKRALNERGLVRGCASVALVALSQKPCLDAIVLEPQLRIDRAGLQVRGYPM